VLKNDVGKLALANSITLTPGTITLEVDGDKYFIHWIDVKDDSVDGASKNITEPFEKFLKVIFG
ncbi:MAG TPA: Na+/H+ antiporter subunit E, partial [Thermococcus sp.]|nr:Na+/H+ antiporter subunit E [Thermococcus sp.]